MRSRLPGSVATAFNESCLRQKVGHLLYLVYRETVDQVSIPIGDLGNFLLFLYEDLNLPASTVRVYKAAILSALSARLIFTPAQLGTLFKLCNVLIREGRRNLLSPRGTLGSCSAHLH